VRTNDEGGRRKRERERAAVWAFWAEMFGFALREVALGWVRRAGRPAVRDEEEEEEDYKDDKDDDWRGRSKESEDELA
jgi:hypothetical protein